jgi:hypothetical protein
MFIAHYIVIMVNIESLFDAAENKTKKLGFALGTSLKKTVDTSKTLKRKIGHSVQEAIDDTRHVVLPTKQDYVRRTEALKQKNEYLKAKAEYQKKLRETQPRPVPFQTFQNMGILPRQRPQNIKVPGYTIEFDPRQFVTLPKGYKFVKEKKRKE